MTDDAVDTVAGLDNLTTRAAAMLETIDRMALAVDAGGEVLSQTAALETIKACRATLIAALELVGKFRQVALDADTLTRQAEQLAQVNAEALRQVAEANAVAEQALNLRPKRGEMN